MKHTLLITTALMLIVGFSNAQTHKGMEFYENGEPKSIKTYKESNDKFELVKSISLYSNGHKYSERTYKDGYQDGLATHWYENGQKESELYWINGEVDGYTIYWTEDGQIESEGMRSLSNDVWYKNYSEGVVVSSGFVGLCVDDRNRSTIIDCKKEYLDGWDVEEINPESTKVILDGKLNGNQIEFYDNGRKKSEVNIIYGEKHGLYNEWYENGQKMFEWTFKDGIRIESTYWDEEGNVIDDE